MAEQSEWDAAYRDVIAKGRKRLGDPPTADKLVAYSRGELSESEAERVRESLAYYPDLAAALVEGDAPAGDAKPYLSDEQRAADWRSLQQRLKGGPAATVARVTAARERPRLWQLATAASLLMFALFASLYVKTATTVRVLQNDLQRPHADVERIELFDDSSRGGSTPGKAVRPRPSTGRLVLTLTLAAAMSGEDFRVDIRDTVAVPPRLIWSSPIQRDQDGNFVIEIPRTFVPSGTYRLNLYDDDHPEPVATYTLRLAADQTRR